jgi:benzoylformate decarboxylase
MTTELQGKHAFMQMLRAEGVRYIFGNPGTSEAPFIGILHEYPDLEYVMVVQEGVAIGMAEGYARASGEVGFVSLHIDNGSANGFSLMIDQYRTGSPVVITAGNKDIRHLAGGRSDLADMAAPFAKWSAEVSHPEQVPSVMRRAFQEAKTPPTGPVFIALSGNAMDDLADIAIEPSNAIHGEPRPESSAVEAAAEALANATNPLMIVGDRVHASGATQAAASLADTLGARAFSHVGGHMPFPTDHPLWCGALSLRSEEGLTAVDTADVILAVGCPVFEDFFYRSGNFVGDDTTLIHIDSDSSQIGRKEPTDIGIWASPLHAMTEIEAEVARRMNGDASEAVMQRRSEIAAENQAKTAAFQELAASGWDRSPIPVATFGMALGDAIPEGANVFSDAISSGAMVNAGIAHRTDLNVMGARGGAIGWGIGATMGMKLANPDSPTIGIVGDGSAMMTVQGLWTAVNYDIPVTYVICNNAAYRILKVNMNVYHSINEMPPPEIYNAMDFTTPFDFKAQAEAYGGIGIRVEHADDIKPAIDAAVASGKPACVDVIIDGAV